MDQTMCRFDMPFSCTNNKKGKKTILIKTTRAEKKGFTVALAELHLVLNFQLLLFSKSGDHWDIESKVD